MVRPLVLETPKRGKQHGYMGAISGLMTGIMFQPLEVIKMGIIINPTNNQKLQQASLLQSIRIMGGHISKTEGFGGFWRGIIPSIWRNGGGAGVYFSALHVYEQWTQSLAMDENAKTFMNSCMARVTSTYVINPFAVVGSRLEVPGFRGYTSLGDGLRKVFIDEGVQGLFRGAYVTALKDGPFAGLYLALYRNFKQILETRVSLNLTTTSMLAGIFAGLIATTSTHPFEIIRSRLQVNQKIMVSEFNECNGLIEGLRKIWRQEGIQGYFRGLSPRLLKKPFINAVCFCTFENLHVSVTKNKW